MHYSVVVDCRRLEQDEDVFPPKFDYFLSMPIVCVSRSNKSYTLLNLQIAKGVGTSCHISSKEVTTTLMGFPARTDFLLTKGVAHYYTVRK